MNPFGLRYRLRLPTAAALAGSAWGLNCGQPEAHEVAPARRRDGEYQPRNADRQRAAEPIQPPPRHTRSEADCAPAGSIPPRSLFW